jgi:hypothetical protein
VRHSQHSWTSALRLMPPASAFRHLTSKSGTGIFRYRIRSPYSVTGLVPSSAFFSFRYRTDRMTDSQAFRHLQNLYEGGKAYTPCTSILLVMERHPARPYCLPWKDTLHVHTACHGKTPCTSILLVMERHPARPYCLPWKDTLNVHTACHGKTPCTSILLVMERHPARLYCFS